MKYVVGDWKYDGRSASRVACDYDDGAGGCNVGGKYDGGCLITNDVWEMLNPRYIPSCISENIRLQRDINLGKATQRISAKMRDVVVVKSRDIF